jgi:4-hydroxybenzoate polyprenyltransferase
VSDTNISLYFCAQMCFSFCIFADTLYAALDLKDDEAAGIKSTARLFGPHILTLSGAFGMTFIVFLMMAGWSNGNGRVFFLACIVTAIQIIQILQCWHPNAYKHNIELFTVSIGISYEFIFI